LARSTRIVSASFFASPPSCFAPASGALPAGGLPSSARAIEAQHIEHAKSETTASRNVRM
jgi:hypothetical protein